MSLIFSYIWNDNIKAWKILWLGLAYYIVFSILSFFTLSLFIDNLYTGQFSGHFNIYTYFLSDSEKTLFSDPAIIDFAKRISQGFGEFYTKVTDYSLTSNKNTTTVFILGVYNFLIFVFWIWWCISLWRNSKNTENTFFSGFLKFVSVNAILYPIYYFILAFLFFNAASYGQPVIEEAKQVNTTEIGGKLNIEFQNINFSLPEDWEFDKKLSQTIVLKKCLNNKENQCGYMVVKKLDKKEFNLNKVEMEEWIKYLNPTHEIISSDFITFKNIEMLYFNYSNIYRGEPSEVRMIGFENKDDLYIIEWISNQKSKSEIFKIFNETFKTLKIS